VLDRIDALTSTLPLAALDPVFRAFMKLTVLGATGLDRRQHARRGGAPSGSLRGGGPDRASPGGICSPSSAGSFVRLCGGGTVAAAKRLAGLLRRCRRAHRGAARARALSEVASLPGVDAVMAAIVGAAGLPPTLAAARAGKRVLLANKEALVMAGAVFMAEARRAGALLLPIDSEHNAYSSPCRHGYAGDMARGGVRRILLTASGGPFRTTPLEQLRDVTPEQAVAHPNWVMGRKISVDSATMMNKGLEVIEAHWLFNAPADSIEVVIHPQSVIHSLVDYDRWFGAGPAWAIPTCARRSPMPWPGRAHRLGRGAARPVRRRAARISSGRTGALPLSRPGLPRPACRRQCRRGAECSQRGGGCRIP
jgi:hypothetical protein